jgi:hypothetical protein
MAEQEQEEPQYQGPVLFYSDEVIDHFSNPRNVGELPPEETDGYACIGDPACGDEMKLWFSLKDERIDLIFVMLGGQPRGSSAELSADKALGPSSGARTFDTPCSARKLAAPVPAPCSAPMPSLANTMSSAVSVS